MVLAVLSGAHLILRLSEIHAVTVAAGLPPFPPVAKAP